MLWSLTSFFERVIFILQMINTHQLSRIPFIVLNGLLFVLWKEPLLCAVIFEIFQSLVEHLITG
jgi:hypothetical protein